MAKKQVDTDSTEVHELVGVNKSLYFVPGIGEIEAESLDEAIKKVRQEEVGDGNS